MRSRWSFQALAREEPGALEEPGVEEQLGVEARWAAAAEAFPIWPRSSPARVPPPSRKPSPLSRSQGAWDLLGSRRNPPWLRACRRARLGGELPRPGRVARKMLATDFAARYSIGPRRAIRVKP